MLVVSDSRDGAEFVRVKSERDEQLGVIGIQMIFEGIL